MEFCGFCAEGDDFLGRAGRQGPRPATGAPTRTAEAPRAAGEGRLPGSAAAGAEGARAARRRRARSRASEWEGS